MSQNKPFAYQNKNIISSLSGTTFKVGHMFNSQVMAEAAKSRKNVFTRKTVIKRVLLRIKLSVSDKDQASVA